MPTSQILSTMDPLIPNSSSGLLTPTSSNQQNRNAIDSDRNLNVTLDERGTSHIYIYYYIQIHTTLNK